MTPSTATQNLNAKLGPARREGQAKDTGIDFKDAPIRSYSPPVRIVRGPGYRGGGYRINV